MSALMFAAAGIAWVGCGVLAYGMTFSEFERCFPGLNEGGNRAPAAFMAVFGPAGLLVALLLREHPIQLQFRSRRGQP